MQTLLGTMRCDGCTLRSLLRIAQLPHQLTHVRVALSQRHTESFTPSRAAQSNIFELEIFESVVLGLKLPNYQFNSIKRIR